MNNKPREFIGRYRIIKLLGRGAMGQVYLAHDPKIDRLVAIKTIIQDASIPDAEKEENRVRFLREAQAAGKLLHPVIVTIFDVAEEEGEMYIAMEYIEGEPLDKYCEKGNLLPHAKVIDYIRQAAEGLDYAHKYQVVHRDIKPANMMVVEARAVKITDFGLAKNPSTSITQQGMLVGTPNYMSPEQIQGHELDGRSDLFSLGVVMYEMLTGERPFKGKSISTVIYKVLHDQPAPLNELVPSLPPAYDNVLQKALAKDPKLRYANGAEFAAALRELLERPAAAPAPPPPSLDQAAATRIEPRPAPASDPAGAATGAAPAMALPDLGSGERVVSHTRISPKPADFQPKRRGAGLWIAGFLLMGGFGGLAWYLKQHGASAAEPASVASAASAPQPPVESPPSAATSAPSSPASSPSAPESAPASAASAAESAPSAPAGSAPASVPASPPASSPSSSASAALPVSAPADNEARVKVTGGNWLISVKGVKGSFKAGEAFALPPGEHQMVLTIPDIFATVTRKVSVKAGEIQEVNVPRPATGKLQALSIEEAKISVDGRAVDVTPMTRDLAVGRHAISAKGAESGEYWDSQMVEIRAGETVTVKFKAPN